MSWSDRLTGALPGRRRRPIFLHIGAMKTGTTYLQELMTANKENLARAGYLFPGERWSDQSRAARDVLGFSTDEIPITGPTQGMWERVSGQMLAHRGAASIYSMEFLSFAGVEQATRIVQSLSPAEVHVVLTVRDAAAAIPGQWQTSCRNTGTVPWRRFVSGVQRAVGSDQPPASRAERMFHRTQGIPRMLDVWTPLVGAERVHVVTVPPRGADPELLWQRFARVVGVDPAVASVAAEASNPSLGHASTELVRRLNVELGRIPRADYDLIVKRQVARAILGERAHLEFPVRLNRRGLVVAARWNRRVRAAVRDSGVELVGPPTDLPVRPPDAAAPKALRKPGPAELLDAAGTAREGLQALRARLAGDASPRSTEDPGWEAAEDPVAAAVRELAGLVRACITLSHEAAPTP